MLAEAPAESSSAPAQGANSDINWERRPAHCHHERFFPLAALRAGKSGAATIRCTVTTRGMTKHCQVVSEDPPGYGFGAQALKMSDCFQFVPKMMDGKPLEGAVEIPIKFNLP